MIERVTVVTTEYNGMGLPARMWSSSQGDLIDGDATSAIGGVRLAVSTARYYVADRMTN